MNTTHGTLDTVDIVVVDDSIANLKLLTDILTKAGYHVRAASDGALALRSIYAKPPALILLDIRMPDMDGFEVCSKLKAEQRTCDIPIIFLTALNEMEDRIHGFALGATDYISKPFQVQDVLMRVKVHSRLFLTQAQLKQQNIEYEQLNQQLKTEITAREQAEIQLKAHQENLEAMVTQRTNELNKTNIRYHALFFEARDGIVLIDVKDGLIIDCNPAFEQQSGRQLSQLKTVYAWDLLPVEQIEAGKTLFQQIVASGSGNSDEFTIQRLDNTQLPVAFVAKVIQLDHTHYLQVMVRDISERKRMEAARHTSDKRFRQLFESMQEGCFFAELIFDESGKAVDLHYLESNPIHAKSLGLSCENIIGKRLKELLPDIDNFWLDAAAHTVQTGEPYNFEGFGRITQYYYDCHYYASGHNQIACIVNDITKRKQTEEERDTAQRKLYEMLENVIQTLTIVLESRDPYTAGHQKRVAKLAVAIAHEMGLTDTCIQGIYFGGLLHDIGKIVVPAEILNKPGRLSPIEYMLIKEHPQKGYDIVKDIDFPWPVAQIILQHHEHIDGSGYPQGLKGDNILLEAKILTIADIVESMYSHRPYRAGLGIDKALAEITRGRASQYEPQVVDACLKLFGDHRNNIHAILNEH